MGMTGDAAYALSKKYTEDTVIGMGAIKGDKGDKGDTGDQGVQGVQGPKGDAATISVGTVTTGTTSSVTNSGTTSSAVFDFVLEKGDKGDKGDAGITAQIFVGTDITGDVDVIVDVATSNVGDLYINSDTSNLYKRTDKLDTANLWEKIGNIKGQEGDDAYEVALAEGFIGTRAEWLESLHGETTGSLIVWDKPNINDDDVALHTWYYYKIDNPEYGSDSAWLNRFNIPSTTDYPAGDYAFFNGISYLCFSCNTPIPALTQKDTTQFYVLYDEKNKQCQAHFVEIATGTDTSLNWTDVTVSDSVPSGYLEVQPDGGVIQYGKWVQTIYLGNSKASAYDCTITTGANVSGFITSETFSSIIGNLGLLTTTDKTNLVSAINEVNSKFSGYVAKTDIVDSLTSTDATKPLSAKQGKELEVKKIDKASIATTIDSTSTNDNPVGAKAVYDIVPTDTHIKEVSLLGEPVADTTKYGDDLLYFPCGVYIFESNSIANNFTNAPVKQAGTFYVTSIVPNKDMNTDTYVYRNYRYETYYGVIYTRSLMTGNLSEGIRRDSGWELLSTTKVADVAKTAISFSSTYYTASSSTNWYMVKDGWATVHFNINVKQPYHPTSSILQYQISDLPKPINDYQNSMVVFNDDCGVTLGFIIYTDGKLFLIGGESGMDYNITFSYPVAES